MQNLVLSADRARIFAQSAYLYGITEDIFTTKNLGKDMAYDHAKPNNT